MLQNKQELLAYIYKSAPRVEKIDCNQDNL